MIDVRFVSVDVDRSVIERYEACLTDAERERAHRFRFDDDTRRAIVSRGALREMLAERVSGEIDIVASDQGKPRLARGGVEFNVSHSGELVMIAIARGPVGVDVERVRPLGDEALSLARRHFSPEECCRVEEAPDKDEAFFEIWTAKEAVVKAMGGGLAGDLRAFTVPVEADEFSKVWGREEWAVRLLEVPRDGYRATIAARWGDAGVVRVTGSC